MSGLNELLAAVGFVAGMGIRFLRYLRGGERMSEPETEQPPAPPKPDDEEEE